jgi:hypothetical protein
LVTLHVWGVPGREVPGALLAMARDRAPLRGAPGLTFGKLLGTGRGRTFTPRDADPTHWAILACWATEAAAESFEGSPIVRRWDARAAGGERLRVSMTPLSARGRWSGRQPFGDPVPARGPGPVAAITRARVRAGRTRTFWRAVPPVSARLVRSPGLLASLGIGEAPVGLQGTFSLWDSAQSLQDFAYRSPEHLAVAARTPQERWFSEELFARFAVREARGELAGRRLDVAAPESSAAAESGDPCVT